MCANNKRGLTYRKYSCATGAGAGVSVVAIAVAAEEAEAAEGWAESAAKTPEETPGETAVRKAEWTVAKVPAESAAVVVVTAAAETETAA